MSLAAATAAESVLQALRTWVSSATGLALTSIVTEPYNGTRPARPYAGVRALTPGVRVGHDYVETTDTASGSLYVNRITGFRDATYSVSFYADDCDERIELVQVARYNPVIAREARASGIVVTAIRSTRAARELLDTEHELRAIVDLVVSYDVEATFNDAVVETVTADIDVE